MNVVIYEERKTATQSGRALVGTWVLRGIVNDSERPEPLMGWIQGEGTDDQVKIRFSSKEEAVSFAEDKGYAFTILPEHARKIKPRNYSDNFKYIPAED